MESTEQSDITELHDRFETLRSQAKACLYVPIEERIDCLKALKTMLQDNVDVITAALCEDFSWRAPKETALLELFPTIRAIDYCIKHCKSWSKPRKRKVSWLFQPAKAHLFPQPLGVVGNMVPWNYPVFLSIVPAAYAIAAGNRVMIKMSELTPSLGAILAEKISAFSKRINPAIHIVNGDIAIAKAFSSLPFGHLMFTGSTQVGKQVMAAASASLTPVTLELGGKSPGVVSQHVRTEYLARLYMGKCINAGQTCIAPDYLLVHQNAVETIKKEALAYFEASYPHGMADKNYSSIISASHHSRLKNLLEDAKAQGAELLPLATEDAEGRKIPLTLIFNAHSDMKVMQEEIFGPLLPIIPYENFSDVIEFINARDKPLALYYFGERKSEIKRLQYETLSGALVLNDTMTYIAIDDLPFGGVGASGMGCYHGREGFDTFSKLKPVFTQSRLAPITWMYPPYGRLVDMLLRTVTGITLKKHE